MSFKEMKQQRVKSVHLSHFQKPRKQSNSLAQECYVEPAFQKPQINSNSLVAQECYPGTSQGKPRKKKKAYFAAQVSDLESRETSTMNGGTDRGERPDLEAGGVSTVALYTGGSGDLHSRGSTEIFHNEGSSDLYNNEDRTERRRDFEGGRQVSIALVATPSSRGLPGVQDRKINIKIPKDQVGIPEDTYSMIFLAPAWHQAFWFAIVVFGFQMTILVLALADVLGFKPWEEGGGNILNVPPEVQPTVYVAQYIALLLAVLSQDDMTLALMFIAIGLGEDFSEYQSALQQKYRRGAFVWQFWLSNYLRFLEGISSLLVSFIFIIQSERVLDIFLNFAAVQFVSELDDLGFRLLKEGWLGMTLQKRARQMEGETLPSTQKKGFIFYFNRLLLLAIMGTMFGVNGAIVDKQRKGYYIRLEACKVLDVDFGGEVYSFPNYVKFKSEERNGTVFIANSNRQVHSFFNLSKPPNLRYAYFSGRYVATFDDKVNIHHRRPVYYESTRFLEFNRGLMDSSRGMFYYCLEERAWVWTVKAFLEAGAVPRKTVERCKFGWLLRSPVTNAVTLEDAPTEGWRIWTGVLLMSSPLSFRCLECNSDIDCGLNRGTCGENNLCTCNDYTTGPFCNYDKPCPDLVEIVDKVSVGHQQTHTYEGLISYGRPQYIGQVDENYFEMKYYTGDSWTSYLGTIDEINVLDEGHGYWFGAGLPGLTLYSERTKNYLPTGPLKWYQRDPTRSEGNYGPLGREIEVEYRVECHSVDCAKSNLICGLYGRCEIGTLPNDFYTRDIRRGGICICDEGYYGHYCEFHEKRGTLDDAYLELWNETNNGEL